mgnify:CR=1 FL=1
MNGQDFMIFMGILAGVISLLAYVPYIASIIRRKTVPSRTTWWILFFIGIVTLITYKESGASNTVFFLVGDVIGAFLTALLSVLYGRDGVRFFDKMCFLGAIISLGLWIIFQENPAIAFSSSLTVEIVAMIPTIRKAHLNPFEEDTAAWVLTFFAAAVNLYAIETWSFIVAFYPFYEFSINGIVVLLLAVGKRGAVLTRKAEPFLKVIQSARLRI